MVSPVTRCSTTFANKDTTYRDEVLRQMPETKLCAPSRKLDTLYIFTILYVYTAYYPFTLPLCFSKRQEQHKPEKAKNLQPTLPTAFFKEKNKNLKQGTPTMWQYVLSKYNQTKMNRWHIGKRNTTSDIPYCPLQNSMNQYHVWYPHHPIRHHEEGLPPVTTLCQHYFVIVINIFFS